jgi:hypothetical protein
MHTLSHWRKPASLHLSDRMYVLFSLVTSILLALLAVTVLTITAR